MTVQNHPVSLTLEPGKGYRVKAQYSLQYGNSATIDILVGLTDPTMWEAQAEACRQAAEQFTTLENQFRDKMNRQNAGQ